MNTITLMGGLSVHAAWRDGFDREAQLTVSAAGRSSVLLLARLFPHHNLSFFTVASE